jgi:molecular chaperone DnaK (HSP70)
MRKIAERGLNLEQIQQAVITVPAYFTERQRNATIEAAEIAGFHKGNIDLITEPAAAAYAYGVHNERYDGYNVCFKNKAFSDLEKLLHFPFRFLFSTWVAAHLT